LPQILKFTFFIDASDHKACEPKDFLEVSSHFFDDNSPCLPSCLETDYFPTITQGNIEVGAIKRYFKMVGGEDFGKPE